jgi:hypothetical protein
MNISEYPLPQTTKNSHNRWIKCESKEFLPDESQRYIMDLVEESLNNGLFYSRDIFAQVEEKIKNILPSDYQRETDRVEGGVLGMEIYYARKAVETIKEFNKANEVLNNLELTEGKWIGTIKLNNGITIHKVKINCIIDSMSINCFGVRGGKGVTFILSAVSIEAGSNRWKDTVNKKKMN